MDVGTSTLAMLMPLFWLAIAALVLAPPNGSFIMPLSSQLSQNAQPATPTNSAPNAGIASFLVIVFALSVVLTLLGYKKYRARQRSRLLKRQIAMLEAMWRISSTK